MSTKTFRQSYTLRHASIARLSVLSNWQNRTPSQQVDQLIQDAFLAFHNGLDDEAKAHVDTEFHDFLEAV